MRRRSVVGFTEKLINKDALTAGDKYVRLMFHTFIPHLSRRLDSDSSECKRIEYYKYLQMVIKGITAFESMENILLENIEGLIASNKKSYYIRF